MKRLCCYCLKRKFEYNGNQIYCNKCKKIRQKEITKHQNDTRNRRKYIKCKICQKEVPKWSKKYCSDKCSMNNRSIYKLIKLTETKIIKLTNKTNQYNKELKRLRKKYVD